MVLLLVVADAGNRCVMFFFEEVDSRFMRKFLSLLLSFVFAHLVLVYVCVSQLA